MAKVHTTATIPDDLVNTWLQHLRNFDATYPGCHFEVVVDVANQTIIEAIEALRIEPKLVQTHAYLRRKEPGC